MYAHEAEPETGMSSLLDGRQAPSVSDLTIPCHLIEVVHSLHNPSNATTYLQTSVFFIAWQSPCCTSAAGKIPPVSFKSVKNGGNLGNAIIGRFLGGV